MNGIFGCWPGNATCTATNRIYHYKGGPFPFESFVHLFRSPQFFKTGFCYILASLVNIIIDKNIELQTHAFCSSLHILILLLYQWNGAQNKFYVSNFDKTTAFINSKNRTTNVGFFFLNNHSKYFKDTTPESNLLALMFFLNI